MKNHLYTSKGTLKILGLGEVKKFFKDSSKQTKSLCEMNQYT